jgi:hypothetical protein
MALSLPFETEDAADYAGDALPVFGFEIELFFAEAGDGVVASLAIVVGSAPLGFDPALLLQAEKGSVDRAFVELENVFTELLDAAGDSETM